MRTYLSAFIALAVLLVLPADAFARVSCSNRGAALRAEVARANSVFTARVEGPSTVLHPPPPGTRGSSGADVTLVVTRVLKGPLRVGQRVVVRWDGWSEPDDGPIIGGCRVPSTEANEPYPYRMLVIAEGDADALRVANRSTSQRIGAANRELVRQVARFARR